jgi:competence protein ComEA
MKRVFPYVFGILLGFVVCAGLLFVTAQPRGEAITLLPAPSPAPLLVDVGGAVAKPGVYSLPPGSRVQDALNAAGGNTEAADLTALNLAARLKDGQKLLVPAVHSQQSGEPQAGDSPTTLPIAYPINLNLATVEELDSLPGIGPTRAQQIIDYRDIHGDFRSIDELMDVPGIGITTFGQLKDMIYVETQP